MNCESALDLIHARLDGELGVEDALRLGGHLRECVACQTLLRDLEHLNARVSSCPSHPHEGQVAERVLTKLQKHSTRVIRPARWFWLAAASGVAAVVVAFLVTSVHDTPASDPVVSVANPNKPETPAMAGPAAPVKTESVFDGSELANEFAKQQFLNRSMAERKRLRKLADLTRDLRISGRAGTAAGELLELGGPGEMQRLFQVAAAVADPLVGPEVFDALAERKPELRLAPLYIAALEVPKSRGRARELLCAVSGKKLGPNRDEWLAWWMSTRAGNSKANG